MSGTSLPGALPYAFFLKFVANDDLSKPWKAAEWNAVHTNAGMSRSLDK
jgi:hypothetical protein